MAGKFRVELHPRGRGGRFLATADKEKPLKAKRVKRINVVTQVPKGTSTQTVNRKRKGTTSSESSRAKLALMEELSSEQRKRLRSVLAKQATKPQPTAPTANNTVPQVTKVTKGKTPQRVKPSKTDEVVSPPVDKVAEERLARRKARKDKAPKEQSTKEKTPTASKPVVEKKNEYTPEDFVGLTPKQLKEVKQKRAPTDRRVVSQSSLKVNPATGDLSIWQDSPNAKFDKSFRYRTDKNFEYKVTHKGQELTLSRHRGVIEYGGEVVKGIPPTDQRLREVKTQSVADRLVQAMSYVEDKANKPPAPMWSQRQHGGIEDKSLVRSSSGAGNYGGMQIHHINQWARQSFGNVQAKFGGAKQITPEQAQEAMKGLLMTETRKNKKGEEVETYCIKVQSKADRELVILPGGLHDINSPLYEANHPHGYHPKTGKLQEFGIPQSKDVPDNRDEFTEWTKGFWREYHRREAFVYRAELMRRVRSGEVKPEEVQTLIDTALEKARKGKEAVKLIRATAESHNKALKAARILAGVK